MTATTVRPTVRPTVPDDVAEEMRRLYGIVRGSRMGKVGPDVAGTRREAARLGAILAAQRDADVPLEALALELRISAVTVRQRLERHVLDVSRADRAARAGGRS